MGDNGQFRTENLMRRTRYAFVIVLLLALAALILVLNVNLGNVPIPVSRILRILFTKQGTAEEVNIIWKIRLPRILMAAVLGGALALSGFLLQTFFGNPIAGPFVLGISSGAKMIVALVMIYFVGQAGRVSSWTLIVAAFFGSLLVTGFILLCARRVHHMAGLLVAGIMVGYICSAVTDFIITFAEDADIINLHSWSLGSFSGMNWDKFYTAFFVVALAFFFTFMLSKPIGAMQLGEGYAASMGVNVKRFRLALIFLSSILSATVTAFAGPISFVGIAVPFLAKRMLGTARPVVVIPTCFLAGSVFCMAADLIARMAFAPSELNISTVTSVFGAPIVLYMLMRRRQGERG